MKSFLYVAGAPGTGKSTLVETITAYADTTARDEPVPHLLHRSTHGPHAGRVVCELGRHRAGFRGTDALAMSIAPAASRWVAQAPHELMLAEGDRLAHAAFLSTARSAGYDVTLVLLSAPDAILEARRARRAAMLGAQRQSAVWVKGRATKADRLAAAVERSGATVIRMETRVPPSVLWNRLHDNPVVRALDPRERPW